MALAVSFSLVFIGSVFANTFPNSQIYLATELENGIKVKPITGAKGYHNQPLVTEDGIYFTQSVGDGDKSQMDLFFYDFNKAILEDYTYFDAREYRSWSYYFLENFNKAYTDAKYLVNKKPNSIDYLYLKGMINNGLEDYEEAINDFSFIISKEPNEGSRYVDRARAKYYAGNYSQAAGDLTKAIKLDTKNHTAYNIRGLCFINMGKTEKGCKDLEKASLHGNDYADENIRNFCR